jgi:hypothetical protein
MKMIAIMISMLIAAQAGAASVTKKSAKQIAKAKSAAAPGLRRGIASKGGPGYYIQLMNPNIDVKKAEKLFPGAKVFNPKTSELEQRRVVLPLREQAELFKNSGIAPHITKFDQFDKDMLVRYLRTYEPEYVAKKYRKIPVPNLKMAKSMLATSSR